ncbi:hypothetical protein MLD38_015794 [Melastoma candidum]|uniref:Uncharacterized protein n=1 Tax=Melastoma candidum TaxID=119954 RepID=A0ACB9RH71_9MYRT|nr:hypothetical protein MLD38_015794 [Melastoma candidum]
MVIDGERQELRATPFWQTGMTSSDDSGCTSASPFVFQGDSNQEAVVGFSRDGKSSGTRVMATVAKFLLPARRRLRLDPPNKLYFPYEPGNQVRSAIEIKNVSKSPVCFKFQTTAPKSCYMRPPGGVLVPGESIIATVFKFVEPLEYGEQAVNQNNKVKFKIMSLRMDADQHYVPEMFDEKNDQVAVEQILKVVFVDPDHSSPALEKLNRLLAEADAALESQKRPSFGNGRKAFGGGSLMSDEWRERREDYQAKHLGKKI